MCQNCEIYHLLLKTIQEELKHELGSLISNLDLQIINNGIYINPQLFIDAIKIARHKK